MDIINKKVNKAIAKTKHVLIMFKILPGSCDEHLLRLSVQKEILLLPASSSS
jgi:hypothetical protein